VLQLASRDRAFAGSLIKPQKDTENGSAASDNATLAKQAFGENDIDAEVNILPMLCTPTPSPCP